jgi:hypothetical protein
MHIDTSQGTHVLGSSFGRLNTTYRDREGDNYIHSVVGTLQYIDDWLLVRVDDEIARYYAQMVYVRFGIKLQHKTQWGAHVSAIRGEPSLINGPEWGHDDGKEVLVQYTHDVYTNGNHWWLNALCDDLTSVRGFYGHPTTKRWFHLTIGRL